MPSATAPAAAEGLLRPKTFAEAQAVLDGIALAPETREALRDPDILKLAILLQLASPALRAEMLDALDACCKAAGVPYSRRAPA